MLATDMIMGRQCHSQRSLRPSTRNIDTAPNNTRTTVYGTEIIDAYYDSCLDAKAKASASANANANAVSRDDDPIDETYSYQAESHQLTPIRSNRNRHCIAHPHPRKQYQQTSCAFIMLIFLVVTLSISFVGLLWHATIATTTTTTTTTRSQTTSRTTARLYNSYSQQRQQTILNNSEMHHNNGHHDGHQHNSHHNNNNNNDNLTNNQDHKSNSNDKIIHNPKSLLLLRHAKSSWDDPRVRDFDRPLSPKGRQDAENLGKYLNNLFIHMNEYSKLVKEHHHHLPLLPPDIIYVSPSVRTRATLELVTRYWKALAGDGYNAIPVHFEQALYDFEVDDGATNNNTTGSNTYLNFVQNLDPIYQRVMIVGHNPAMEQLVQQLAGEEALTEAAEKLKFPPGTFCELVFDNDHDNDNSNHQNSSNGSDNDVNNNVTGWNTIQVGQGQGEVRMFLTPKQTSFEL